MGSAVVGQKSVYEQLCEELGWSTAEAELGFRSDGPCNIGWLCTNRLCYVGLGNKPALIWEDFEGHQKRYTFDDLRILSNTIAHFLRGLGIEPGERVCLFLDRVPELYIGLLGILKTGAIAQPLFSAFGDESLHVRLSDAETSAIITQRKHLAKVRKIRSRLPALRHIIVVDDAGAALQEREVLFHMEEVPPVPKFDIFPAKPDTPSILHYTSGTTGQPKGAQHVHNSIIAQYLTAKVVLDLKPTDIYWCNADPGWVTGTSYGIIGPWANGITQVVLDAGFNAEAWYAFIARHRVTVWYSAPTAIRLLMKEGSELPRRYDLSSLRHLASVGEPLNAEAVTWSEQVFGRPFHDTFWQTETGCIVVTNLPGMPIKPGSMGRPFPGITATVVNTQTYEPITEPGVAGIIALRPGWPSQICGYWNNPAGYAAKFKNGWYLCGDRASIDSDGYFWFMGRDDDVINTGGHLVGPFEIEFVESLPKTRSGKIVRRILRCKEFNEPVGDLSTVMND